MIDRYTKTLLTIIAIALVMIAMKGVVHPAKAQSDGPTHVIVDQVGSFAFSMVSSPMPVRAQN
jgi:hypothetical protein